MLPGRSGFDVCRKLRQSGIRTSVLMLTARGGVIDKVEGLQIGADDYMTKPFEMAELLARIEPCCAAVSSGRRKRMSPFVSAMSWSTSADQCDARGSAGVMSAREFQLLRI